VPTPPSHSFRPWKVLDRREAFALPPWVSVAVETIELPDGRRIDDYVQVHVSNFAIVFAETADGQIICVRQYRHAPRGPSLEFVAGRIDDGEDPLAAAKRELLEETGYDSPDWELAGRFIISPTQGIGTGHVYRAHNAVRRQAPCSGDLEEAVVELLDRDALVAALVAGEIVAGSHIATMALVLLR
jgi:ADP-ribose pyrophosphatase